MIGNKTKLRLEAAMFLEDQKDEEISDDENIWSDRNRESDDESGSEREDGRQNNPPQGKYLLRVKDVDIFSSDNSKNIKR